MSSSASPIARPQDYEKRLDAIQDADAYARFVEAGDVLEGAVTDRRRVQKMGYESVIARARAMFSSATDDLLKEGFSQ